MKHVGVLYVLYIKYCVCVCVCVHTYIYVCVCVCVCVGPDNRLQDALYVHQSTSKYGHRLTKDNKQDTNETDIKYTETKHSSNETTQYGRKINIKYYGKSQNPPKTWIT